MNRNILKILVLLNVSFFFSFTVMAGFNEDNSLDLGEKIIESRFDKLKSNQQVITYEDLQHPNKGCPENSVCSKSMGAHFNQYHQLIQKLKNGPYNSKQKVEQLEQYRKTHGLPFYFLSLRSTYEQFSPIMYNSACSEHNPKTGEIIFKSLAFITGNEKNLIQIKRGHDAFSVPQGEVASLTPIEIYNNNTWSSYSIPFAEKPLFVDGKSIIFNHEYEGLIYYVRVSTDGRWQVIEQNSIDPNIALSGSRVECPKGHIQVDNKFYKNFYCMNIYDTASKKELIMRLPYPCM
jgi:hypothetical protein